MNNLTTLANNVSITSLEIAELLNCRHDSVKRTIDRLTKADLIAHPPMVDFDIINNLGLNRSVSVYSFSNEQGKRDSIIVVAQLSPEFTARLVDRWTELEAKLAVAQPSPTDLLNNPAAMRKLLLAYSEKDLSQQKIIQEQAPKVAFHDQVAVAPDAITMAEAAKLLGTGRTRLMSCLRQKRWLNRQNEPYQDKIDAGLMDLKLSELWEHPDKGLKRSITPLMTGKGLTYLRRELAKGTVAA